MADGTRLYELLARIKPDGSVGLSVRDLVTVGGRDYEGDPRPVSAEDAEVFAFIAEFNAAAAAAAESAVEALAAKDAEIEQLNADKAALQARVEELEAAAAPTPGVFAVRDVIGRLPAEKLAAAFNAALQSPPLLQFFLLLLADTGIRADDPRTVAGLAAFVESGLLTPAEATALFPG